MTFAPYASDPQAYWDAQLKFSEILPGFQGYLAQMTRDSADFAADRTFTRIETGPDPRQWLEWSAGEGTGDEIPVIIHGGYWRALKAEDHRFLMAGFLPFGPAVASLEYRLKPQFGMAECIADVVAGLKTLQNAFPGKRFLLIGHSAGAHLAVSAVADPVCAHCVAGIIALSGVYDLAPVTLSSVQSEIGLTPQDVTRHSLMPSDARPPVLYVNGSDETHEFLRGSHLMATQGRAGVIILPGADHMSLLWAARDAAPELMRAWQSL